MIALLLIHDSEVVVDKGHFAALPENLLKRLLGVLQLPGLQGRHTMGEYLPEVFRKHLDGHNGPRADKQLHDDVCDHTSWCGAIFRANQTCSVPPHLDI